MNYHCLVCLHVVKVLQIVGGYGAWLEVVKLVSGVMHGLVAWLARANTHFPIPSFITFMFKV
jgi:hypothetical protein